MLRKTYFSSIFFLFVSLLLARTSVAQNVTATIGNYNSANCAVGDTIVGDITVISARFNPDYAKHKITARMGESFVDFWFGKELTGNVSIKAKIKSQRGDNTTQLNYVKILG